MARGTIQAGRAAVEAFLDDRKLNQGLRGMQDRLRTAGNLAAKAVGGAMVAAAGVAVWQVRKQMQELDAIGKRSRTLGMDPAEMMELAHVAERAAGITGDSFERGYQRFLISTQDAINGSTQAQRAFEAVGVSADDMIGLSATDRLKHLAEGFRDIEDPAERAHAAQALFGRGNAEMALLLDEGADGIDHLTNRWRELTGIAGTMDTRGIERANDAFADIRLTLDALAMQAAVDNADDLAVAFQFMAESIAQMRGGGPDAGRLVPWLSDMADIATAGSLIRVFKEMGEGDLPFTHLYETITGQRKLLGQAIQDEADATRAATDETSKSTAAMDEAIKAQQEFADSAEKVIERLREQVRQGSLSNEQFQLLQLRQGAAGDASRDLADDLQRLIEAQEEVAKQDKITDQFKRMAEAFRKEADEIIYTAEELQQIKLDEMLADLSPSTDRVGSLQAQLASLQDQVATAEEEGNAAQVSRLQDQVTTTQRLLDLAQQRIEQAGELQQAQERLEGARITKAEQDRMQDLSQDVEDLTQHYIDMADAIRMTPEEREREEFRDIYRRIIEEQEPNLRMELAERMHDAEAARADLEWARNEERAQIMREGLRTAEQIYEDELAAYQHLLDEQFISQEEFERRREQLRERHGLDDETQERITTAGTMAGHRLGAQFESRNMDREQLRAQQDIRDNTQELVRQGRRPQQLLVGGRA